MTHLPESLAHTLPSDGEWSGLAQLLERLPVGVIWMGSDGEVRQKNKIGARLLEGPHRERLGDTFARLRMVCADSGGCSATSFDEGNERVIVELAQSPDGGFIATVKLELLPVVVEVRALHTMLTSMASEPSEVETARKALALVQRDSGMKVAFFRHQPASQSLICEVTAGYVGHDPAGQSISDHGVDLVAQTFTKGRTVIVREASRSGFVMPLDPGPYSAALAVPVWAGGKKVGVVTGIQPTGRINPVMKRLLESIAVALTTMAHQRSLQEQTARARDVAAQRDRLATIGQLVAGVAHEINNPLAFLKSNLYSLKAEVEALGDAGARALNEVEEIVAESLEGVARIEAIVQALKSTARQRNEKLRFDPARAVSEAVTIFRGAKKGELEVDLTLPQMPDVIGSPAHLGQVALNLMQNGLDAMGGRGRLKVEGIVEENGVRFSFTDTGTGIPEDVQKQMYDAFFTTKELGKGTGLGLYLCQGIVTGMDGKMSYRTGPGGTTFEVWLPTPN